MNRDHVSSSLFSIIGLLVVLAITYGCTKLNQSLLLRNARSFDLMYLLPWSYALTTILSVGALLLLFWLVMTRASRWIGFLFIMVGIFLLTPVFLLYMANFVPLKLPFSFMDRYPETKFFFSSAGILMTGLFALVLPRNTR